jgi:NarL family two-component system response regulator LiaR
VSAYTVVLVEDHALTRAGLHTALDAAADLTVVAEAGDGVTALDAIARLQPDVAVLDIGLPGLDGIELTRRARTVAPKTHVVILTMHDLEEQVLAALAAGADAYCLKSSRPESVVTAVRVAAQGGAYFDPRVARIVMRHVGSPKNDAVESPLTARETDVLRMIADGRGNAEIASTLGIGLGTVKGHVRDVLEKLSAADRTQAAVVALRRGLI